jgi:squalene synthase HpnC
VARSISHYENFPVASLFLPARLRSPVRTIYAFARFADDIADEGNFPADERLARLDEIRVQLDFIRRGKAPRDERFRALASTISQHALPLAPFYDLLSAFRQDVSKQRYANFAEVMDYCSRSANPIGRLLLHLYHSYHSSDNAPYSDAICSSLQLINFLQDVAIDYRKGRVYLPQDELAEYGIDESVLARESPGPAWHGFMAFQTARAEKMLDSGRPLGRILRGRVGLELRIIIEGGQRILEKLRHVGGDVFRRRPTLNPGDWGLMLKRAL